MANTKTTTPTSLARPAIAALGILLAVFAAINLFASFTPAAKHSERLDAEFQEAKTLPPGSRFELFKQYREDQASILAQRPSDPYGWERLSYLRLATTNNKKAAFSALAMSDLVSPYEAPQLPERAVMWSRYRDVETPDQQAYQDVLWQRAYTLEPDPTWQIAVQYNLVAEVEESLKKTDSALAQTWAGREANLPH